METDHDTIDALERQLQRADLMTPRRSPWIPEERDQIVRVAKECLGIREEWIPRIAPTIQSWTSYGEITIGSLRAVSWARCFCAAHIYMPSRSSSRPLPLVLLCCGHARGSKQADGYRRMAWRLACQGCAVLVPDIIGKGERSAMGHRDAVAPFRCGLSLQGMIVMETMGWLRWALSDERFDDRKIAAIGNSGGGVLTLFLGAFCRDDLAALSSSGYPSTFHFIAAKEKKHCHCNILPGIVGSLQMWQLYGCFAPKPLYIFQGKADDLFPEDLFHVVSRRTANAYSRSAAASAFKSAVFPGGHPWDDERRSSLTTFLTESLDLEPADEAVPFPEEAPKNCYAAWPKEALTTDELAAEISGRPALKDDELCDVYLPGLRSSQDTQFSRVGFRQLAAQLQAFTSPDMRASNNPAGCDA